MTTLVEMEQQNASLLVTDGDKFYIYVTDHRGRDPFVERAEEAAEKAEEMRDEIIPKYNSIVWMHTDVSNKHSQVVDAHVEVMDAAVQVGLAHEDVVTKHGQIVDMHADVDADHKDVVDKHGAVVTMHGEVEADRAEVAANATKVEGIAADIDRDVEDVREKHADVVLKHTEIEADHKDVVDKHTAVVTMHGEVEADRAEVATNTADVRKLKGEVDTAHGEVEADRAEVETNTATVARLKGEVETAHTDVVEKHADIALKHTEVEADHKDVVDKHTAVVTMHGEVEADRAEVATNTADVRKLKGEVDTAHGEVEADRVEVAANKTAVDTAKKSVDESQADVVLKHGEVVTMYTEVTTMHGEVTTMHTNVEGIQTDVTAKQTDVTNKHGEVEADRAEVAANKTAVDTAKKSVDESQADVTKKHGEVTTLTGEAKQHRDDALTAKTGSETARDTSEKWAENPVDKPVETDKFSALHHSEKAKGQATVATGAASNAKNDADRAQNAAGHAVNAFVNGGVWNPGMGPGSKPKPDYNAMYYVDQGGKDLDDVNITWGVGDWLMWSNTAKRHSQITGDPVTGGEPLPFEVPDHIFMQPDKAIRFKKDDIDDDPSYGLGYRFVKSTNQYQLILGDVDQQQQNELWLYNHNSDLVKIVTKLKPGDEFEPLEWCTVLNDSNGVLKTGGDFTGPISAKNLSVLSGTGAGGKLEFYVDQANPGDLTGSIDFGDAGGDDFTFRNEKTKTALAVGAALKFKNQKVYHAGDKPTLKELGAAAEVHEHTTAQVDGLDVALASKAAITGDAAKTFSVAAPSADAHAANRKFVNDGLSKKSNTGHEHETGDVSGLDLALAGKSNTGHDHAIGDVKELTEKLAGKSNTGHDHAIGDVKELTEKLAAKAKIGGDAEQQFLVKAPTLDTHAATRKFVNDGLIKKSNTGHEHKTGDVSGLDLALEGKANTLHKHDIGDVRTLTEKLANKSEVGHDHTIGDVKELTEKLAAKAKIGGDAEQQFLVKAPTLDTHAATRKFVNDGLIKKSNTGHEHKTGDVSGLDLALEGKANTLHKHDIGDVRTLTEKLANKSEVGHDHTIGNITDLRDELNKKSEVGHEHKTGDVAGLDDALAGKSPTTHKHDELYYSQTHIKTNYAKKAGDFTQVFAVAPPTKAEHATNQEWVSNKLGGKSDTGHDHNMDKINGLEDALAKKSDTGHTHTTGQVDGLDKKLAAKAPLTGAGTSGTWPISITGNANTATKATNSDNSGKLEGKTKSEVVSEARSGMATNTALTNHINAKNPHKVGISDISGLQEQLNYGKGLREGTGTEDPNLTTKHVIITNHANSPDSTKSWHITSTFEKAGVPTANKGQIAVEFNSGSKTFSRMFVRAFNSSTGWSRWNKVYTDYQKPTPGDIGAPTVKALTDHTGATANVHGATSGASANRIVARDANKGFSVNYVNVMTDPTTANHAVNKSFADKTYFSATKKPTVGDVTGIIDAGTF